MKKQEIELLSPAGSYEGFEAAIGAGADAVYVGTGFRGKSLRAEFYTGRTDPCDPDSAHSWQEAVSHGKHPA